MMSFPCSCSVSPSTIVDRIISSQFSPPYIVIFVTPQAEGEGILNNVAELETEVQRGKVLVAMREK
jgi:hypothetical protein